MTTTPHSGNPGAAIVQSLDQAGTIKLLLNRSLRPRRTVPIRRTFLQQGTGNGRKTPGPLRDLVHRSQQRPLDLYLLVSAVTSGGDFSVTEWSNTWARVLGIYDETSGTAAVSRAWKVLRELGLITRARGPQGKAVITKLMEDGLGAPYTPPATVGQPYLQLPFAYWDSGWHETLTLPAKAVLLIALSQRKESFALPHERMRDWYGISPDVAGKGIRELLDRAILWQVGDEWFDTLRTKTGRSSRPLYALRGEFTMRGLGTTPPAEPDTQPAPNPPRT